MLRVLLASCCSFGPLCSRRLQVASKFMPVSSLIIGEKGGLGSRQGWAGAWRRGATLTPLSYARSGFGSDQTDSQRGDAAGGHHNREMSPGENPRPLPRVSLLWVSAGLLGGGAPPACLGLAKEYNEGKGLSGALGEGGLSVDQSCCLPAFAEEKGLGEANTSLCSSGSAQGVADVEGGCGAERRIAQCGSQLGA